MTAQDDPDFDARVSAYLDGALDEDSARAMENTPGFAERLALFREGDALAAKVFADELAEPVPASLAETILGFGAEAPKPQEPLPRRSPRRITSPPPAIQGTRPSRRPMSSYLAMAASLLVAAALGAGGMWAALSRTAGPPGPGWVEQVADYHRIYANEVRHRVEVPAEDRDHIIAWLGERVGGIDVPDLSALGLRFEGARLLVASGEPVAQLVYLDAENRMFALCVTPRPGTADAVASTSDFGDLEAVSWRQDGQALVVIGPAEGGTVDSIAQSVGAFET